MTEYNVSNIQDVGEIVCLITCEWRGLQARAASSSATAARTRSPPPATAWTAPSSSATTACTRTRGTARAPAPPPPRPRAPRRAHSRLLLACRLKITKEHTIKSRDEALAELQAAQGGARSDHDMFCSEHVQVCGVVYCVWCSVVSCGVGSRVVSRCPGAADAVLRDVRPADVPRLPAAAPPRPQVPVQHGDGGAGTYGRQVAPAPAPGPHYSADCCRRARRSRRCCRR